VPIEPTSKLWALVFGLGWRRLGPFPPKEGSELVCTTLSTALVSGQLEFSIAELAGFGIKDGIQADSFVRTGTSQGPWSDEAYYTPTALGLRDDDAVSLEFVSPVLPASLLLLRSPAPEKPPKGAKGKKK